MERLRSPPWLVRGLCGSPPRPIALPPRSRRARLDAHASPLEVVESQEEIRTRVRLRGELDIATGAPVAKRLAVLRERGESVVLDLDGLTFIDLSGVRLVLAAAEESRRDGWTFTITRGSRPVRRLLGLLELDEVPYDGASD